MKVKEKHAKQSVLRKKRTTIIRNYSKLFSKSIITSFKKSSTTGLAAIMRLLEATSPVQHQLPGLSYAGSWNWRVFLVALFKCLFNIITVVRKETSVKRKKKTALLMVNKIEGMVTSGVPTQEQEHSSRLTKEIIDFGGW